MTLKTHTNLDSYFAKFDEFPDSANVRLPIVMALWGISSATVWRNVKNGKIPKPRKLTSRTTVFNVGELRAALAVNQGEK